MSKREEKKEHILLAGMEVMKSHGYQGTSVKDIVDAAGVPKGSFYNYFDSKEAFALEAIDHAAAKGFEYAESILLQSDKPALDRLLAFYEGGIECACSAEFRVGCFLGNMCQEMADSSGAIREKLSQKMGKITGLMAGAIRECMEAKSVDNVDPETAAEFLFNAWEGALMRAKATKTREPLDAYISMARHILA